jgi:xanthine dehydrogenase YagS FAD-binding subunit
MCVALALLNATVQITGFAGRREIAFDDFHRLPADTPHRDTNLNHGEIITAIELPPQGFASNYAYLKIRDRSSYAFALVSVAVGLTLQDGLIREARIALGGVAPKPWRVEEAEAELSRGAKPAAAALLDGARATRENAFKLPLVERTLGAVLAQARA